MKCVLTCIHVRTSYYKQRQRGIGQRCRQGWALPCNGRTQSSRQMLHPFKGRAGVTWVQEQWRARCLWWWLEEEEGLHGVHSDY
jgi:hypothetical protein